MNVWFTTTDLYCAGFIHHFEKTNANDFILQIPSCQGLNLRYGKIINEAFIIGKPLDALKAFINESGEIASSRKIPFFSVFRVLRTGSEL